MSGSVSPHTQVLDLPELRNLCAQLAHWAFTDFSKAREALETLSVQINSDTSFDVRLSYHRHNAFFAKPMATF